MKFLIVAAVMGALLTGAAVAQTTATTPAPAATPATPIPLPPSTCPALQSPPTLPDGATSTRAQMAAGDTTYQAWAHPYQAAMNCRRNEIAGLEASLEAARQQFNVQAGVLNTTTQAWTASAAAFNTAHQRPSH